MNSFIVFILQDMCINKEITASSPSPMLWKGFAGSSEPWIAKQNCKSKARVLCSNLSITIFQRTPNGFPPSKSSLLCGCNSVNSSIKSFRFSETTQRKQQECVEGIRFGYGNKIGGSLSCPEISFVLFYQEIELLPISSRVGPARNGTSLIYRFICGVIIRQMRMDKENAK